MKEELLMEMHKVMLKLHSQNLVSSLNASSLSLLCAVLEKYLD